MRRLCRVQKDEAYPCQMSKTQSFSCLFRHYAKHNGLKKEDLVFYFVDELKADETPESVHLMHQDEIWVERRKHDGVAQEVDALLDDRAVEVAVEVAAATAVGEHNATGPSPPKKARGGEREAASDDSVEVQSATGKCQTDSQVATAATTPALSAAAAACTSPAGGGDASELSCNT
jgi:hypothetical protein